MNVWNVITFRRNATSRQIWKNSSLLTSNTAAAANINLSSTQADIGNTQEYSGWDAGVSAFVLYNRGISDSELTDNVSVIRELNNV